MRYRVRNVWALTGDLQSVLDEMARDGWRLHTATPQPGGHNLILIFEKEN